MNFIQYIHNKYKIYKHRKMITFLDTKDGKVKNINEIANMLTDDLKSKICVEKEFKDVLTNLSA